MNCPMVHHKFGGIPFAQRVSSPDVDRPRRRNMDGRLQRRSLGGWGLFALVGVLLCFGALNIAVRATWHKLEDGVLWQARPEGVMAAEVAPRSTAMTAGIRRGDILIAINGSSVETPDDVKRALTLPHTNGL